MSTASLTRQEVETLSKDPEVLARVIEATDQASWTYTPFGESEEITLNLDRAKFFIANPTKSGKYPSKRDLIEFLQVCSARRLNPYVKDAFLVGYDTQGVAKFSIITAYQALAKRAESNQHYDGIEWGVIVKRGDEYIDQECAFTQDGDKLVGGWATVYRKDKSKPFRSRLKLTEYTKQSPFWKDMPTGMIGKCARAAAMREAFPSDIGGLIVQEELKLDSVINETNRRSKLDKRLRRQTPVGTTNHVGPQPDDQPVQAAIEPNQWELAAEFEQSLADAKTPADVQERKDHFLTGNLPEEVFEYVARRCEDRTTELEANIEDVTQETTPKTRRKAVKKPKADDLFEKGHDDVS